MRKRLKKKLSKKQEEKFILYDIEISEKLFQIGTQIKIISIEEKLDLYPKGAE